LHRLNYHILFFFRRKMHACPECGKHYMSKLSLTRHMVIHSQESKFLCEDCGKSLGCKDHLEGHKMRRIVARRETWGCMAFQHRERPRRKLFWVKLIYQKVWLWAYPFTLKHPFWNFNINMNFVFNFQRTNAKYW
jgi:predicted RNA-binding Zn-ribbon protein involved in translation (DUF1610 family)